MKRSEIKFVNGTEDKPGVAAYICPNCGGICKNEEVYGAEYELLEGGYNVIHWCKDCFHPQRFTYDPMEHKFFCL